MIIQQHSKRKSQSSAISEFHYKILILAWNIEIYYGQQTLSVVLPEMKRKAQGLDIKLYPELLETEQSQMSQVCFWLHMAEQCIIETSLSFIK